MAKTSTGLSLETGMLAYARSIQITEGLFHATSSSDNTIKTPIEVVEKGVRGQSSEDKAKKPGESNPQSVEFAVIPSEHDGVAISFWIRFMPLSLRPHACDDPAVGETYARLAQGYRAAGGYSVLAELFAWNIVNARFAWRNRFQSDNMSVTAEFNERKITFDPFKVSLEKPNDASEMADAIVEGHADDLSALIEGIAWGLSNNENKAFTINILWQAAMRPGQEIFPSQEYVRKEKEDDKLSRIYAKLPAHLDGKTIFQASMHSQKIGAALRHIDIWHSSTRHDAAIAVNPYGGIQQTGDVLRDPQSKKSFYDLRKKANQLLGAVENARLPNEISGDVHFVMANLVRGGVFNRSNKKAEANG